MKALSVRGGCTGRRSPAPTGDFTMSREEWGSRPPDRSYPILSAGFFSPQPLINSGLTLGLNSKYYVCPVHQQYLLFNPNIKPELYKIRTDTTLDLSQKAKKGMLLQLAPGVYILCERHSFGNQYGIKTQVLACLLACLRACPLFALRLFCVFHFVPRFSRIFV